MKARRLLISSVVQGYEDRRSAAAEAISALGVEPVFAKNPRGRADAPRRAASKTLFSRCGAVVGIYGQRYGRTGSESDVSPTEEEYDRAREHFKPIFAFIDGMAEGDLEPRQKNFLELVHDWDVGARRRVFHSLAELQRLIREALTERDLSSRYGKFLDRLNQEPDLKAQRYRKESKPFVPGFDLILHSPARHITTWMAGYIIVIDGDLYDRDQLSSAVDNWRTELPRLIATRLPKVRLTFSKVLIVVDDNPHGHRARVLRRSPSKFAVDFFDEILVDLRRARVDLPPGQDFAYHSLKDVLEDLLADHFTT